MKNQRFLYFYNDKAHFRRFLWGLVVVAVFAGMGLVLIPIAQAANFSCTGATANGNLFTYDVLSNKISDSNGVLTTINTPNANMLNDDPYTNGSCTNSLGIFGRILCFFKSTVGQIISQMYCGFQNQLQGPLGLILTFFVIIVGVTIMTGMVQVTVREGIMALLKIALVWVFATNAAWGIGIGYAFFMGLAEEGSALVLSTTNGGTALTTPDSVITGVLNFTTTGAAGGNPLILPATLSKTCMIWLMPFLILLFLYAPVVAIFICTMIIQYLWLYARALLGYLTALVLIGFLFILAPLFITFVLFSITRPLFEQWLKYLTSFSLQMVIVFAFLAILNMIPLGDFFREILGLLRDYNLTIGGYLTPIPITFCGICSYTIDQAASLTDATPPITCKAGPIIPLFSIFTSQDLVQAVVSQAVALWIIGNVMQDFLKKAPEFARDLTGRLPFAAALGAGSSSMGESPSIEYAGLDTAEAYTMSAPQKYMGNRFGARDMMLRAAVLGGVLAKTGAFSVLGRSAKENDAAKAAAAAKTSMARVGSSGGVGQSGGKTSGTTSTASNTNQGVMRSAPRITPLTAGISAANVFNYDQAVENLNYNQTWVQNALVAVQDPNLTGTAKASALATLKKADDAYLMAWRDVSLNQRAMLTHRQSLQTYLPQERTSQIQTIMGTQEEVLNAMESQAGGNSPGFTTKEMADFVKQNADHLALQINVQNQFDPDKAAAAQALHDQAALDLHNVKTEGQSSDKVMKELEGVMRQLYVVEKTLT